MRTAHVAVAAFLAAGVLAPPAMAWDSDPQNPCVGYDKTTRGSGPSPQRCLKLRNDCGKSVEGFVRTEDGVRRGTGLVLDKQTGGICLDNDFRYEGSKLYKF